MRLLLTEELLMRLLVTKQLLTTLLMPDELLQVADVWEIELRIAFAPDDCLAVVIAVVQAGGRVARCCVAW